MCAMGHPKPAEGDCLALHIYGGEGQIFNGTEYLCLNWMCEFSPFYQNSRYSRFLIAMVPTDMYWKSAVKTNLTLQSLLQVIVQSIQTLEAAGAAGLHGTCVVFKGDWKFLVQSMSLRHHPGTDRICWCCPATKSLRCPYVDMSPQALCSLAAYWCFSSVADSSLATRLDTILNVNLLAFELIMFADSTMCFARQSKGCMMPCQNQRMGPAAL